jgi:hypothetical protein
MVLLDPIICGCRDKTTNLPIKIIKNGENTGIAIEQSILQYYYVRIHFV